MNTALGSQKNWGISGSWPSLVVWWPWEADCDCCSLLSALRPEPSYCCVNNSRHWGCGITPLLYLVAQVARGAHFPSLGTKVQANLGSLLIALQWSLLCSSLSTDRSGPPSHFLGGYPRDATRIMPTACCATTLSPLISPQELLKGTFLLLGLSHPGLQTADFCQTSNNSSQQEAYRDTERPVLEPFSPQTTKTLNHLWGSNCSEAAGDFWNEAMYIFTLQ